MAYYDNCAIPKPKNTKKKKKTNGYKNKAERICYYHKTPGAERNEVYGGNPNRQISIDHGFQVDLCPECHRRWHEREKDDVVTDERIIYWREYYQREYEAKVIENGVTPEEARKLWMLLIGRNYLEEV